MVYVATISVDYSHMRSNDWARLQNALIQAGWEYAETSTFIIERDDVGAIRMGLELLARALELPGELSFLNISIALVGEPKSLASAVNHTRALEILLQEPLPSEW